jgi:SAM-dependent methyltransferase
MRNYMKEPWEHPDWYDLHDNTWTAGPDREPEHYRESVLALPPLDRDDHLIDLGAGTGKLALLIAKSYPSLGKVTLVEPNAQKLERARTRLEEALPQGNVTVIHGALGEGTPMPESDGTVATIGSVLMPIMELRGGTLAEGLAWLRNVLAEVKSMLDQDGWLYDLETLAAPWALGSLDDPVRRLTMRELMVEFDRAGFEDIECAYRFRDRVMIRARKN